jgi:hypothetical protein
VGDKTEEMANAVQPRPFLDAGLMH